MCSVLARVTVMAACSSNTAVWCSGAAIRRSLVTKFPRRFAGLRFRDVYRRGRRPVNCAPAPHMTAVSKATVSTNPTASQWSTIKTDCSIRTQKTQIGRGTSEHRTLGTPLGTCWSAAAGQSWRVTRATRATCSDSRSSCLVAAAAA